MQPSMEVRWFLRGDMPRKKIQDWFKSGSDQLGRMPFSDESRDDIYLSLTKTTDLSIKMRAGKNLEIKQRKIDAGMQVLKDGSQGRVEQWVKWSFSIPEKNEKGEMLMVPDISSPEGSWTVVQKRRLLRKFEVKVGDIIEAVDAIKIRPKQGCNLDIAWIEAGGQKWWSLGFESFGNLDTVEKNLLLVLNYVLADPAFPTLQAANSFAYPTWLSIVLTNGE